MAKYGTQPSPDVPRRLADTERRDQRGETRLRELESLAAWVRKDLYNWLLGLAAFVGYTATLRRPPQ